MQAAHRALIPVIEHRVALFRSNRTREVAGPGLREQAPLGTGEQHGAVPRPRRADRLGELQKWLGLHHHAGAAAVRRLIDGAVPVVGEGAQVPDDEFEQAPLLRPPEDAGCEGSREHLGKDRDDVDAHYIHSGGMTIISPASRSIRCTTPSIAGRRVSGPPSEWTT